MMSPNISDVAVTTRIVWDIERSFTSFSSSSVGDVTSDQPESHVSNGSNCSYPARQDEEKNCAMFRLVFNSVVIGLLCVLGVAGNTLSILVLHKDRMNKVAIFLLQCLAFADNSLLLVSFVSLSIFYGLIPYVHPESDIILKANIIKYMMPIGYMTQTAAIWATVLLAVNRYIAICRPFEAHRMCTYTKAKLQVAIVFTFSVLFNVPRFFQYRIEECYLESTRILKLSPSPYIGTKTEFGKVYTNALYTVLVLLLPLLLLLFLNTKIIMEMRRSKARLRRESYPGSPSTAAEENISFIMVIIIINFIICHVPDRLYQITIYFEIDRLCHSFWYYANPVCNLLIIISSSSNFIIYYVFRKRFRAILKNRLFHCDPESLQHINTINKDMNGDSNGNKKHLLTSSTPL